MSGPLASTRFCSRCGRPNDAPRTTCWGCGAALAPAAFAHGYGAAPPTWAASRPLSAGSAPQFQPPGFAGPLVPPGFVPPPPRPPKKGLSTGAIVAIVVVVVLLVSVVPAAVLYVLTSGLTLTSVPPPYELGMTVSSGSFTSGPPATGYVNLSLYPNTGLTTAMFGLRVVNETSGSAQPLVSPSLGCVYGGRPAAGICTSNGTGWYAVLENSSGSVVATYGGAGWTHMAPGSSSADVTLSDDLLVVSSAPYQTGDYLIEAFSTGSASVTGSAIL